MSPVGILSHVVISGRQRGREVRARDNYLEVADMHIIFQVTGPGKHLREIHSPPAMGKG